MKEDKEPTAMPIMRETKDKSKETNKKKRNRQEKRERRQKN